jgi:multidrug efflux pump subunit AcrA (membrane-fusion protein)
MRMLPSSRRGRIAMAAAAVVLVVLIAVVALSSRSTSSVPTAQVTRGEYADVLEIRGDIRPVRSTYVMAPSNAGELLILKIAKNGTAVKPGDVVAEFDAINIRRTIQEKQSELRSAIAERDQAKAQATITLEEKAAAVRRARFDLQRAELAVAEDVTIFSTIQIARAKLAVADAEQRLREAATAESSTRAGIDADFAARERRIEKTRADLDRAQNSVKALYVTAPTAGTVSVLPNYRSATPMGTPQEYRSGDRTFPGAMILELPDLTSVYLVARIEEADRGQLKTAQSAIVRADAVPDRDYNATVTDISLLARVDFMGGWPPAKLFDLKITLKDPDERLRAGMSAAARITVGRVPNVLLVPAEAVFTVGGRTVVYRAARRGFEIIPVEVIRNGRGQAAIRGDLPEGPRVALTSPDEAGRGGKT